VEIQISIVVGSFKVFNSNFLYLSRESRQKKLRLSTGTGTNIYHERSNVVWYSLIVVCDRQITESEPSAHSFFFTEPSTAFKDCAPEEGTSTAQYLLYVKVEPIWNVKLVVLLFIGWCCCTACSGAR
jgi:hypothetical protein